MQTVIMYDPSISSLNLGDKVISLACRKALSPLLQHSFVIDFSSHLPITNSFMKHLRDPGHRFLLGSNLLMSEMNHRFRQWDVTLWNSRSVGPVITMGVGWHQYSGPPNRYTATLYRRLMNHGYWNSVRDDYTLEHLRAAGVNNVLNTACPSLWSLTPDRCRSIPREKASRVVTTFTDYNPDKLRDRATLKMLLSNYEGVYVWPQSEGDPEYLRSLGLPDEVTVLPPNLEAYDRLLLAGSIDYVGTRLHGGIRALQHGVRTFILAIDNRAKELHRSVNLPIIMPDEFHRLEEVVHSPHDVTIQLPEAAISKFLGQFGLSPEMEPKLHD